MSTPMVSASIYDTLLGRGAARPQAEARAAVEAGATELAIRLTLKDLTGGEWLDICAEISADAVTGGIPFDITLALEEPVRGVEAIVEAKINPARVTFMPETLDFLVSGQMIMKKQTIAALADAVQFANSAGIPVGLELFHAGGAWFVSHLRERGLVNLPDCVLPFNLPGTCWSPAHPETLRFRRSLLPQSARLIVQCGAQIEREVPSAMGLMAIAIGEGHDIRVGLDAWPVDAAGRRFGSVADQVRMAVDLIGANAR